MVNLKTYIIILTFIILISSSFAQQNQFKFPKLSGDYLGQTLPGDVPELFAPDIISTGIYERDFTMTADGNEIYFGVFMGDVATILVSTQQSGIWSEPAVAEFAKDLEFKYFEPAITPDGKHIYFCCTRPRAGEEPLPDYGHQHIWAADRQPDGSWGEIYCLPAEINSDHAEYYPTITKSGTIYFTRHFKGKREQEIFRSKLVNGKYTMAERLPDIINKDKNVYNAFIDPDEKYLLACLSKREDSITPGSSNYYIFFRNADDTWSEAINLGEQINFPGCGAIAQSVSPDGKYLFFAAAKNNLKPETAFTYQWMKQKHNSPQNGNSDIYWVEAGFIEELKK